MVDNHIEKETLNLQDLLVDDLADELSDYLSVSIQSLGGDTKVSVTTVEDSPVTYTAMINGVSLTDMQFLVDAKSDIVAE